MKIKYLQISNILSFKYYDDIATAPKIIFNDDLNILIGQNGSGKSTALEVINFIFKRILLHTFNIDQGLYKTRSELTGERRRQILKPFSNPANSYSGFRLEPNWNSEDKSQRIRLEVKFDEIDKANLALLKANQQKLSEISNRYTTYADNNALNFDYAAEVFVIEITLDKDQKRFTHNDNPDPGFAYLVKYKFYKELINLYNAEHPKDTIPSLYESFTLIGGYRNYNVFTPNVNLGAAPASQQIQEITNNDYNKSANANEQNEPTIFNLVRLRLAEKHYNLYGNVLDAEAQANNQTFLSSINKKLKILNLEVQIKFSDKAAWGYSFSFFDTKRKQKLPDINSLSAGQKAIIHLIFEAYGRGDLKGGVIIIDEPEIHLHYQFQNEYLRVIDEINKENECQYILVTHSESLINSTTIGTVRRFALDENNYTEIKYPNIQEDQKTLIKILDNTKSTYAFFARKVVLVEGDTDRYFFKAVFQELAPHLNQEIAILDIGGKGSHDKWRSFFESFGLTVYYIGDFDNVFSLQFSGASLISPLQEKVIRDVIKQEKLDALNADQKSEFKILYDQLISDPDFITKPQHKFWEPLLDKFKSFIKILSIEIASSTKSQVADIESKIDKKYVDRVYILKKGSIEEYSKKSKKLDHMIKFCEDELPVWLKLNSEEAEEIKSIVKKVIT